MALELEGRIVRKLPVQQGTSARGAWAKQEFIFEYQEGNFPSQICMNVWGDDKVKDLDRHQVGDKVKISFNLSSREYNGRWYTDVRAWRIEPSVQQQGYDYTQSAGSYSAPTGSPAQAPMPSADDLSTPLSEDDLPF